MNCKKKKKKKKSVIEGETNIMESKKKMKLLKKRME